MSYDTLELQGALLGKPLQTAGSVHLPAKHLCKQCCFSAAEELFQQYQSLVDTLLETMDPECLRVQAPAPGQLAH